MFDLFELNKIAGAVLFSILLMFGISIIGDTIFDVETPKMPGDAIEVAKSTEPTAEIAAPKEAPAVASLSELLAGASAEKGQSVAKKCAACHTFNEGGKKRVGPNLHGVVGRPVASSKGFAYSSALKDKGGTWGYTELDGFLEAPKTYLPGTSMAFKGINKPEDRANLIAYLRSLSPDAPPLPQ